MMLQALKTGLIATSATAAMLVLVWGAICFTEWRVFPFPWAEFSRLAIALGVIAGALWMAMDLIDGGKDD